jgi:CYTH domain-containing protein/thymidylate kinase
MGKLVSKIAVTGGPCGGKTTALSVIEQKLTDKGYKVFIVGESATELIKGGIRPFGDKAFSLLDFQEIILQLQLNKQRIYEESIKMLPEEQECVIIYDRGIIDNKAYIGQKLFDQLLNKLNLKELTLMDNYDMVLHLVTAADGAEKYYTLDNNTARTETIEEARALDKKTSNAWLGHSNLKIIDNSTNFEDKINKVLEEINNEIGEPICIKKQRKFTIDLEKSTLNFIDEDKYTKIDIEQTYLEDVTSNQDYENRLRKRTYNGETTYYLTVQRKEDDGVSKVATNKKLTKKEYNKMLSMYKAKKTINKTRYTFIKNKQYFRLDIFDKPNDLALLEVEQTDSKKEIELPKELKVIKEVTNDPNYQNSNLIIKNKAIIKR